VLRGLAAVGPSSAQFPLGRRTVIMSNSPDSLKGSPTVTPYCKRTNASGAWGISPLPLSPSTSQRKWVSPARTPPKRSELFDAPAVSPSYRPTRESAPPPPQRPFCLAPRIVTPPFCRLQRQRLR